MIPSRPPTLDTLTIDARAALEHARQDGQGQAHRGEEVDPHDGFDLVGIQRGDGSALRDRGVVDQHVDAAERVPRLHAPARPTAAASARSATHIVESGRGCLAVREHLGQPVAPAGDQPDDRPLPGEQARQRSTNAGRGAGDEHPLARRRERHGSRLARVASCHTRFADIRGISDHSTLEAVVAQPQRADAGQGPLGLAEHPRHGAAQQRGDRLGQ